MFFHLLRQSIPYRLLSLIPATLVLRQLNNVIAAPWKLRLHHLTIMPPLLLMIKFLLEIVLGPLEQRPHLLYNNCGSMQCENLPVLLLGAFRPEETSIPSPQPFAGGAAYPFQDRVTIQATSNCALPVTHDMCLPTRPLGLW